MGTLSTVEEVIDAVGGTAAATALAGVKWESTVFNWRSRRKIPPEHFWAFSQELKARGFEVDPSVFGFEEEARA